MQTQHNTYYDIVNTQGTSALLPDQPYFRARASALDERDAIALRVGNTVPLYVVERDAPRP